jgi:probable H4MPT-linked C1 transfer pathway protein
VAVILGWDIGGVNTKAVRLSSDGGLRARSRPFELQRDPGALVRILTDLASELGAPVSAAGVTCAVTMTAELSQMFRTKRDGVAFVLDAVSTAFPDADIQVFATDGSFLSVDAARQSPLAVAAANWAATARLVARRYTTALLIDVGTTTTDIIPIVDGHVVAAGTTDPERLASGELVYTGALRTPVEAIVRDVPYRGGRAAVSAEGFALVGDVHLWRGSLDSSDYTVPAPDGRTPTREFAGERLARVICADREMLEDADVAAIADAIAAEQVDTVAAAIRRVRSGHPSVHTAVVTGLGAFIARKAARAAGLEVVALASEIGDDAARYAPAAAVALLVGPANAGPHDRLLAGPAKAGPHYRPPGDRRGVRLQPDLPLGPAAGVWHWPA